MSLESQNICAHSSCLSNWYLIIIIIIIIIIIFIIIIITTCYGATQPVLSSALQQYSVHSLNVHKSIKYEKQVISFQLATKCIMWFNVLDVNPRSRSCDSKQAVSKTCPCRSNSKITTCRWAETVIVTQDGQVLGCRAMVKRQTTRRTVCTLCACEPVTSVNGVAMVQHGCELALSISIGQHYPEFAAFFYAQPHSVRK